MNQEQIGKFIAKSRKKQHLTQIELADRLGVTDKSVSRWENGKTMPDVALIQQLCQELKITVTELLNGEELSQAEYQDVIEKNMLKLVKDKNNQKNKFHKLIFITLTLIIILTISLIMLFNYIKNYMSVAKTFELNFGIILPSDFQEEYYIDTGPSFHGDGERYSVFTGNSFLTALTEEKNEDLEQTITELVKKLNIPKKEQINFQHKYAWVKITKKDDERNYLYCIYDKEITKFYFYEFLV